MTIVPTAPTAPATPTAATQMQVSDLFVERVADKNWRDRIKQGLPPSMFFDVRGVALLGDKYVSVEFNRPATNELGQRLRWLTTKADRNGNNEVVIPKRNTEHSAQIKTEIVNGEEVPVLDETGMPILHNETVVFPAGWNIRHVCKARVNTDRTLAIDLHDVEIVRAMDANTKQPVSRTINGVTRECYKLILHNPVIDVTSIARDTSKDVLEDGPCGVAGDWRSRAAARKTAATTPAMVSQALVAPDASDALAEAAAAAGAQF